MKVKKIDIEFSQYTTKEKDFDCVKMMRKIRSRLFEKYIEDTSYMKEDLDRIRKKYGIVKHQ